MEQKFNKTKIEFISDAICGIVMVVAILAYCLAGIIWGWWHPGWVIVVGGVFVCSIISIIVTLKVGLEEYKVAGPTQKAENKTDVKPENETKNEIKIEKTEIIDEPKIVITEKKAKTKTDVKPKKEATKTKTEVEIIKPEIQAEKPAEKKTTTKKTVAKKAETPKIATKKAETKKAETTKAKTTTTKKTTKKA